MPAVENGCLRTAPSTIKLQHPPTINRAAPTFEKQCLRSRMNAFSCWVLRAVVRHTARQYSKGVAQWPVSGLPEARVAGRGADNEWQGRQWVAGCEESSARLIPKVDSKR